MKIISRVEAKSLGLKRYFTGKLCKHGHIDERFVSNCRCCKCSILLKKEGTYKQKPEFKERNNSRARDRYNSDNAYKERILSIGKKYRDKNKDKERARTHANRVKFKAYYASKCAERRAMKLKATPEWRNNEKIAKVYDMGKKYNLEVDHIVPIQSDLVCGLHCWDNLQLLSRQENARKLNKHWPDMP